MREYLFKSGQHPWNYGSGGCKRGHEPSLYVSMPGTGIYVCLVCKRENSLKYRINNRKIINLNNRVKRYKIDINTFHKIYNDQNGKCAICADELDLENCRIDHDHNTEKVRGILCVSCNTGIGLLQDSPDILANAVNYLRKNND